MKRLFIICLVCVGALTVACQKSPAPEEETVDAELLALQARTPRPLLDLNGTIWTKSAAESCENLDERGILIPEDSTPVVGGGRSPYVPKLYYAFENGLVTVFGKFSIQYGPSNIQQNVFWLKTSLGQDKGKYSVDESTMTFATSAFETSARGDYKIYILNGEEFHLLGKSPWKDHDFVLLSLRPATSEERASIANAVSADDPNYSAYIQQMFDSADKYAKSCSVSVEPLYHMIQYELDLFFEKSN